MEGSTRRWLVHWHESGWTARSRMRAVLARAGNRRIFGARCMTNDSRRLLLTLVGSSLGHGVRADRNRVTSDERAGRESDPSGLHLAASPGQQARFYGHHPTDRRTIRSEAKVARRRHGDTVVLQPLGPLDNALAGDVREQVLEAHAPVVIDLDHCARFEATAIHDIVAAWQLYRPKFSFACSNPGDRLPDGTPGGRRRHRGVRQR